MRSAKTEQKQTELFADTLKHLTNRENSKAYEMLTTVANNANTWDTGKAHRWIGYAQCLLIAEGAITLETMRNITRDFYQKEI